MKNSFLLLILLTTSLIKTSDQRTYKVPREKLTQCREIKKIIFATTNDLTLANKAYQKTYQAIEERRVHESTEERKAKQRAYKATKESKVKRRAYESTEKFKAYQKAYRQKRKLLANSLIKTSVSSRNDESENITELDMFGDEFEFKFDAFDDNSLK